MTDKTSWNDIKAKEIFGQLTKIAEGMLDNAAQAPEESAGTAGPQEVLEALTGIISELEQVAAAIPAESSPEEPAGVQAPVATPEEPKIAQLNSKIAELELKVESAELEKIAEHYAELYDDAKVKQAKYDEVLASKEKPSFWSAKIDAIESFKKEAGVQSYRPAQQTNSWLKPMTRVAKQGNEVLRL